jgi:hypothetical protein
MKQSDRLLTVNATVGCLYYTLSIGFFLFFKNEGYCHDTMSATERVEMIQFPFVRFGFIVFRFYTYVFYFQSSPSFLELMPHP